MKILLSNASAAPIYEQIAQQIQDQIVGGELDEGHALPSIRKLAKELLVSVITTKRAYEAVEKIDFEGAQSRTDIAARAFGRKTFE